MEYVIVGIVSVITSTLSAVAGGGGGLLTAPTWLLLGFTPNTVVATQKSTGIGLNLGALLRFYKERNTIQWQMAALLSGFAIVAAYVGTEAVFMLDEDQIQLAIAAITIAVVPIVLINKNLGLKQRKVNKPSRVFGYGMYWIILTIQAGVGAGVGTLNMLVLMGPMGLDALQANATKRVVGFVITFSSMMFFIGSGYVDWSLAGVSFVAGFTGGRIGASIALEKGAHFVKHAFAVIAVMMALLILIDL